MLFVMTQHMCLDPRPLPFYSHEFDPYTTYKKPSSPGNEASTKGNGNREWHSPPPEEPVKTGWLRTFVARLQREDCESYACYILMVCLHVYGDHILLILIGYLTSITLAIFPARCRNLIHQLNVYIKKSYECLLCSRSTLLNNLHDLICNNHVFMLYASIYSSSANDIVMQVAAFAADASLLTLVLPVVLMLYALPSQSPSPPFWHVRHPGYLPSRKTADVNVC